MPWFSSAELLGISFMYAVPLLQVEAIDRQEL